MSTALKLGPLDHDKPLTLEEFLESSYERGYDYEIIQGRLHVTPAPRLSHDRIVTFVYRQLLEYSRRHPDSAAYVTQNARVFVERGRAATAPEPDIALYREFPDDADIDWQDVQPLVVVEVAGREDAEKDFDRNVKLYREVAGIQEYWVFDIRRGPTSPLLHVYRRQEDQWQREEYDSSETYRTDLLPGLILRIQPTGIQPAGNS